MNHVKKPEYIHGFSGDVWSVLKERVGIHFVCVEKVVPPDDVIFPLMLVPRGSTVCWSRMKPGFARLTWQRWKSQVGISVYWMHVRRLLHGEGRR